MTKEFPREKDFYRTSDLALATAISIWYPLEAVDKQNSHKAQFLFKRDAGLDEFIENYWRGELRVEPRRFFNQLRDIKARLYERD